MAKMKRLFLTVALTAFLVATCGSAAFAVNLAEELTVPEMARFLINNVFYFDYDKSELQTDDVQQMIESLDDKYSQYFTPEQYKAYTNELDNERPMVCLLYTSLPPIGKKATLISCLPIILPISPKRPVSPA